MKQYAVIGEKLPYTLSPQIHSVIFEKLGLKHNYTVLEIKPENMSKIIDSLKVLGFSGVNVTIPYKEVIMPYLDYISDEALLIGAVNTVKIEGGKAFGYNTDYFGFGSMLERAKIEAQGKDVVIFGAGGAAKAMIAYFINKNASSINVICRNKHRAESIEKYTGSITCTITDDYSDIKGNIAVNATPIGMFPNTDDSIIGKETISNFDAVVDAVYNPVETKFIRFGKELGKTTTNGLYMLIDQAIKAQEIFQDTSIDYAIGDIILDRLFMTSIR